MDTVESAWSVAEAKSHLSALIERTLTSGPQAITRRGKAVVIVVSSDEWARKTRRSGTLAEFLAASPLRGVDVDLERVKSEPRDLEW